MIFQAAWNHFGSQIMFKNKLLLAMILCGSFTFSQAEPRDFGLALLPDEPEKEFVETENELPNVPNPNAGDWLDIYVNETHRAKPRILLDSLQILPDKSIRYVFNSRSASGYDNVTAEGMLCAEGLFNSDGVLQKTFAYADLSNQRWIIARNGKWQVLGGKRNAADPVRRVLYETFCVNDKILNEDQLKNLLRKHAGSSRESRQERTK